MRPECCCECGLTRSHSVLTATVLVFFLLFALTGPGRAEPEGFSLIRHQANRVRRERLDRRMPMPPGSALRVENRSGSIRVESRSQSHAHVTAVGPAGSPPGSWYTITPSKDRAGGVNITIPAAGSERIDVAVTVPPTVRLQLITVSGAIEIDGGAASVTAESQTGDIRLAVPAGYDADLSLHSTSGSIRSALPTTIFGLFDAHNLQAKLGRGGAAIILRSLRGNISLEPLASSAGVEGQGARRPAAGNEPVTAHHRGRPQLRTSRQRESGPSTPPTGSKESAPTGRQVDIQLEAPLVNLNVSVSDRSGRAISGLRQEDFTVYEDGVRQEITHFAPATTPFDLVLLLDLSGSTEKKVGVIKQAAEHFVDLIKPGDRLAVYTFRRRVRVISHLSNDRLLLKRRIRRIRRGKGGTAFYDSLWFTADELERSSSKRKAIVVMTDGVDNSISYPEDYETGHSFQQVMDRLGESDLIVYPIYLDTEYEMVVQQRRETSEAYAVARQQLAEMAERTAGVMFRAHRVEELEGVYQRVAHELRTVYSLAYTPARAVRDGTWRRIRVRVNRPNVSVRTKPGYYARE